MEHIKKMVLKAKVLQAYASALESYISYLQEGQRWKIEKISPLKVESLKNELRVVSDALDLIYNELDGILRGTSVTYDPVSQTIWYSLSVKGQIYDLRSLF